MIPLLALCALAHSLQRYVLVLRACMYVCIGSRVWGRKKRGWLHTGECVTIIYLPTYSEIMYLFLSPRRRSAGERSHSPAGKYLAFCFVWHPFAISKFAYNNIAYVYNRVTPIKKTRLCKNHAFWLSQRSDLCKTRREIRFFTLVGRALCKPKRRHSTGPEFIKKSKLICSFDSKHVRSTYVLDRWEKA